MPQLILRQARVEDARSPCDVVIDGGRVRAVGDAAGQDADEVIDCAGRVVLPGFVEPHLHLDKALLDGVRGNPDGTLAGAIAVTGELKSAFTHEDVLARARRVLEAAVLNGTTVIRAHPDVDPIAGLLGVEVLLQLRAEYADVVDLQIVAFPQEGVLRSPGTEKLLIAALAAGADVVGGCTYNEATLEDCHRHVELVLDLAAQHGVPADLHADFADDASDPGTRSPSSSPARPRAGVWGSGGARSYDLTRRPGARGPGAGDGRTRRRGRRRRAAPGDRPAPRRSTGHPGGPAGVAPVRELWDHGVLAACSSNNIRNAFTPFGRADPLDTALLLAQTGHLSGPTDLHRVLRMVTHDAARVVGVADDYGVRPGDRADLVVLDTQVYDDIVLDRPERAHVIKAGRVVARTVRTSELLVP